MTDAEGNASTQLNLEIVSQKNDELTVKLKADREWILDENRSYPITIDPTFITSQEWQKHPVHMLMTATRIPVMDMAVQAVIPVLSMQEHMAAVIIEHTLS